MPSFAFVTLVTSDHYLPGALVVAAALRDVHISPPTSPDELDPSEFDTVCLVTPETVDVSTVKLLRRAFDVVIGVEVIEEENEEGLKLLGRPDLRTVLTKLHMFRLISYRKLIFLDADVLPLRPLSHLFRIDSSFAAVPDVGWPDIFNSGFLVFEPGEDKFKDVMEVVKSKGSWDGGDQGVLNEWMGKNWERLSFMYNTTPTAAYTYAPAYKRFGSQISNIHFIGPNKPWTQIPFRSPGASSSSSSPTPVPSQTFSPPPSYAYPALLDRWFAVYDKHYRSTAALPAFRAVAALPDAEAVTSVGEFGVRRYESVWDSDARPSIGAELSSAGAPLGLGELRRLAVEGVGGSGAGDGEGAYRSLPLEGRVDLMRPQKPPPSPQKDKPSPVVRIQVPDDPQTPMRWTGPMTTLPTPGPNEFPPTPVFRGHSLPPETPTHARVENRSPAPSEHEHLEVPGSPALPAPPIHPASPARSVSPAHHTPPLRHASPPLLVWNPAIEAPPTAPPPASHFPEETYFPNVWDSQAQDQRPPEEGGGFFPLPPQPSIPERLIQEGHYRNVIGEQRQPEQHHEHHAHEQQQHQGPHHHEHHLPQPHHGHEHHEHHGHEHHPAPPSSQPQPDRTKIATVFPWEEKPRHAPDRFFPRTDSPPPGKPFIEPQPPALKLDIRPPQPHKAPPATSPPQSGFPRTTSYANAWDAVPSIQRYASRLVRPAPVATPLTSEWTAGTGRARKGSAATAGGDEYRSWQDQVEVSSRDADDEDEGDDEDEDPSPPSAGAESDRSDDLRERPPRGEKKYKVKSVQTMPKEVRHQSVQVGSNGKRNARSASGNGTGRRERGTGREKEGHATRESPPKLGRGLPQEMRVFEQMATGSPAVNAPGFMLPVGSQQQSQQPDQQQQQLASSDDDRHVPSGVLSPRLHDEYAFGSIPHKGAEGASMTRKINVPAMPELSPPVTGSGVAAAGTVPVEASPASSLGPNSPPEGAPILPGPHMTVPIPRPAGRTFDPARGVDVFKKGSEEVLARFLKMGSWEEDSPTGPGSPSAS